MSKYVDTILSIIVIVLIGAAVSGIIAYRQTIKDFVGEAFQIEIAIATTPSGAAIILDGKKLGQSPVRASVAPGVHTLEVRRLGYQTHSQAIEVYYPSKNDVRTSPWVFNLALKPGTASQVARTDVPSVNATTTISPAVSPSEQLNVDQAARRQIADLRSLVLANPEDAIRLVALRDRFTIIAEETKTLRQEVSELKTLSL